MCNGVMFTCHRGVATVFRVYVQDKGKCKYVWGVEQALDRYVPYFMFRGNGTTEGGCTR